MTTQGTTGPVASETPPSSLEAGSRRAGGRPRTYEWPTCPQCSTEFRPTTAQRRAIEAGRKVHCSRACQKASTTETRPCAECGKDVTRSASDGGFRGARAFCSDACRASQPMKPRTRVVVPCGSCGKDVERTPSQARGEVFCSLQCKGASMRGEQVERPERPCETCGDTMRLSPDEVSHGKRFCSQRCAGIGRRRKPGERYVDKHGYAWITTEDGRSRMEHQVVMEQIIGRPLLPEETVHHRTGGFAGRSDNDPGNLELWSGRHPKGHRVEDIVAYCVEMLALYAPERLV